MKRIEQLQKLSREHHQSLVMAKRISDIANSQDKKELLKAIENIKQYYDDELEEHFQHEERTIFAPIFIEYREHIGIATSLLKEHGYIRMLIPRMTIETAQKDLAKFSSILKTHTRTEERELFPLVEKLFSDEQLNAVLNFTPLD